MIAYKLVRQRKDGTYGSLFINRKSILPVNVGLPAEDHPTKGYAHRFGGHCTLEPEAPHLTEKGRVGVTVEVEDFHIYERPKNQGGKGILANGMKILPQGGIYEPKHRNP